MVAKTFDHLCTSSDPMERKIYDAAISRFGRDAAFRYVGEISDHGNLYTLAVGNLMVGMRCSAGGLFSAIEHCNMHPTYYQWWCAVPTSIEFNYTDEEQAKALQMLSEAKKKVIERQGIIKEYKELQSAVKDLHAAIKSIESKIDLISQMIMDRSAKSASLYADLCKMNFSFLAEETK